MSPLNKSNSPSVSICMITYNHEPFIAEAIEGVLMQKTNFPFKLIIGEDFSSDKTRIICEKYKQQHPELIELLPTPNNLGMMPNFIRTLQACNGKYIALCEGDDYWTDPLKLQKQVDFLEANEEYSICAHNVNVLKSDNTQVNYYKKYSIDFIEDVTIEELSRCNLISTTSVLYRRSNEVLSTFSSLNNIAIGDYTIHLLNACHGKIKIMPETMAVYRVHGNSVWSSINRAKQSSMFLKTLKSLLDSNYIKNPIAISNLKEQAAKHAWVLYKHSDTEEDKVNYFKICATYNAEFLHGQFENKSLGLKKELNLFVNRQISKFNLR